MDRHGSVTARLVAALLVALLAVGAPSPALADDAEAAAEGLSADRPPELESPSAFLMEADTGTVLLDKNADERREPASTTKVMTALVTIEHVGLDEEVTVEESDFDEVTPESSVAGLVAGETLTVRDLLACMLLPSGNDAAYVLARYVGGGDWHAFVDMMNQRAAELGCADTHFANPCGLSADGHYTTARDLATIMRAAIEHPEFTQIAGSATWDLPATSGNDARTLESTDLLIDPESPVYMGDGVVTAGKTGFTNAAGRCLVVSAEGDGMRLVGVTLGAAAEADAEGVTENYYDMRSMLEWGFGAWSTGDVVVPGDVMGSAGVMLSSDGDSVEAVAAGGVEATVPRGTTLADLTLTPSWQGTDPQTGSFRAPLETGQALGTVDVSLGDRWLASVPVTAARSMGLSVPALLMWWLSDPLHAVIAVACAAAVLVVVGLAGASVHRRRPRYQMAVGQRRRVEPGAGGRRLEPPAARRGGHRASGRPRGRRGTGRHLR